MDIISIEPRDIYIKFGQYLTEIEKILLALEHAKITYDGKKEPEVKEAVEYLTGDYFKTLTDVVDKFKEE